MRIFGVMFVIVVCVVSEAWSEPLSLERSIELAISNNHNLRAASKKTLLTQAKTNYYQALYDYNLAWARLQKAIGRN
ncbi:MAG: hypothetical protein AB1414_12820 [bacterium]